MYKIDIHDTIMHRIIILTITKMRAISVLKWFSRTELKCSISIRSVSEISGEQIEADWYARAQEYKQSPEPVICYPHIPLFHELEWRKMLRLFLLDILCSKVAMQQEMEKDERISSSGAVCLTDAITNSHLNWR